jgi:hypothetical protein
MLKREFFADPIIYFDVETIEQQFNDDAMTDSNLLYYAFVIAYKELGCSDETSTDGMITYGPLGVDFGMVGYSNLGVIIDEMIASNLNEFFPVAWETKGFINLVPEWFKADEIEIPEIRLINTIFEKEQTEHLMVLIKFKNEKFALAHQRFIE